MSEVIEFKRDDFAEDEQPVRPADAFQVQLDGYEGPIDALLQLAREQKVDLTSISILALADQYLEFVREARKLRLELAADYLVMAAWLAYLKSRLLLPDLSTEEEPSGAEMAAALKFQLQRLQAMQDAAGRLMALPQLGRDFFARGQPEPIRVVTNISYDASLYDLLKAYGRNKLRADVTQLRILATQDLFSVDEAVKRLGSLLDGVPGWRTLASFLPPDLQSELQNRSALASTFVASLEMCREGKLKIRQEGAFGTIFLSGGKDPGGQGASYPVEQDPPPEEETSFGEESETESLEEGPETA
ncbi:MAG: ScpA family protein [Pseudomonadota bacterium]